MADLGQFSQNEVTRRPRARQSFTRRVEHIFITQRRVEHIFITQRGVVHIFITLKKGENEENLPGIRYDGKILIGGPGS